MQGLLRVIEDIRRRLPSLRRKSLNEISTRTIVIDPLLEALGWNVRNPEEVDLEYSTIDGKSADYALKIDRKPVLFVEAKSLGDALDNVKAITQVVGYAANAGVTWCVLTNGVRWKVYRSIEKCPAPEKLVFEIDLDPKGREGAEAEEAARKLWRLSRKEVAQGSLDRLGEQVFTDKKVHQALEKLLEDPPGSLLNLIRKKADAEDLKPAQIRESIARYLGLEPAGKPEKKRSAVPPARLPEEHHLKDKPQEVIDLYRAIDRFCLALDPGNISKRCRRHYIGYARKEDLRCAEVYFNFCRMGLRRKYIQLVLTFKRREEPLALPTFAKRAGSYVKLRITERAQLPEAERLIRQAFERMKAGWKR